MVSTNHPAVELTETHHIIPRSLESSDFALKFLHPFLPNETIELPLREHFICHLLLMKMFKPLNEHCYQRMAYAVAMMSSTRHLDSKQYAWSKRHTSEVHSNTLRGKPSRAKGKRWSKEARERKSLTCPSRGKTYEEIYGPEKAAALKAQRRKNKPIGLTSKGLKFPRTDAQKQRYSESAKQRYKNGRVSPLIDTKQYVFGNVNTGERRNVTRKQFRESVDMSGDFAYLVKTANAISRSGWTFVSFLES